VPAGGEGLTVRILLANDGIGDAGGVQSYLAAVIPALLERGHEVAFLHHDRERRAGSSPAPSGVPHFCMEDRGVEGAVEAALAWGPEVCFSHNMRPLEAERRLLGRVPVVKMMHGYFGTCLSGEKTHLFPTPTPCGRAFGVGCLALYLPRRCGPASLTTLGRSYAWAVEQRALFGRYAAVVVASEHMRGEYERGGVPAGRVHVAPLFPTQPEADDGEDHSGRAGEFTVLFLGRMTRLKGGDLLVRAVADASRRVGAPIRLVMAGDGPQRAAWEALARRLGVAAEFPGWVEGPARTALLRSASLLAVPSIWPEPFGLTGLEAGALGVPALALDVGGIGAWLRDGENGWLVPRGRSPARALADGLVRAHRHPEELRALACGAREAARRLSLARHVERLEEVLASATSPAPAPA